MLIPDLFFRHRGRLVPASKRFIPHVRSYFFVYPETYLATPKVARPREWLFDEASKFPSPASAV
jgi:hypothetical protein